LRVSNIGTMFGRRPGDWRELWTKPLPILAAITAVNEGPEALNDYRLRQRLRQLGEKFAAIRAAPR
jgi:hypothetical protein